jgi:IclR family mhp operon transcriptional activator
MPSYKPINAVVRALDLLLALNHRPVSSVEYLHRETGIPKSTLVRLLETLGYRGFVHRGPRHGSYQLTALVASLSAGYHSEPKIVEAAGPVAVRLTKDIKWPVAVATFDVDAMVIQFSTIPYSPVAPYHSALNRRLSMVRNALGRAYLAYCSQSEREIILRMVARRGDADDRRIASNGETVRRIMAETRSRGYAVRDLEAQPESNSIAVPLFDGDSVAASMSITWYRSALTAAEAAQRYRARLMAAGREISERCLALRGGQPQIPQGNRMPALRRRR